MRPVVRQPQLHRTGSRHPKSLMDAIPLHLHESMQPGRRRKNSSNQLGHKISNKTQTQAHPSSLVWFPFTPREGRQNKCSHLIIQLPVETGNLLVIFLLLLCRDAGNDRRDVVNNRGVITGLQVLLVLRADLLILGHGFSCGHTSHGSGQRRGEPKATDIPGWSRAAAEGHPAKPRGAHDSPASRHRVGSGHG